MSIDRRLREGLRVSADVLTPDPLVALHTVERKTQRQRRRVLALQLAAAAAAIALVIVTVPWSVTQLRGPASVAPPAPASPLAWRVCGRHRRVHIDPHRGHGGQVDRQAWLPTGRSCSCRQTRSREAGPVRHTRSTGISCAPTPSSTISATPRAQEYPSAPTGGFARPRRYGSPSVSDSCEARRLFFAAHIWERVP